MASYFFAIALFAMVLWRFRIQNRNMLKRAMVGLMAAGLLGSMAGCTIYREKRPATLASTTSAEQYERLYWKAVQKGDWQQAAALQGPSIVYATRQGELVDGARWLSLLQGAPPKEYLIGAVQVKPQGSDTVVSYFASVTDGRSTTPIELAVVSLWQQVGANLIMVAHSETPRAGSAK